jgi:GTP-binding protein
MKPNLNNVELRVSAGFVDQFPSDRLPQAAFSGRSNVGKSSLINTLLGRKSLARVSASPGKTITVNFYAIDKKMYLVDLPGYGYAKRTREDQVRWSTLTEGYFTRNPARESVRLVVQLVDSRIGFTEDDAMMLGYMNSARIPYVVAATKTDKLNKTERAAAEEKLRSCPLLAPGTDIVMFSSQTGEGKQQLLNIIFTACGL